MHVYDGAYGGDYEYTELSKSPKVQGLIKNLNQYIESSPKVESKFGDKTMMLNNSLDIIIDDLVNEKERLKVIKNMQKLMVTSILFGIPNTDGFGYTNSFNYIDYKKPLTLLSKDKLQTSLNKIVLQYCKNGVQILNTNLKVFGLTVNT